MKLIAAASLAFLGSCMAVGPQGAPQYPEPGGIPPPPPEHQFSLSFGQRHFTDDDNFWEPNEDQGMFAFEFAEESSARAIGWEVGFAGSGDESTLAGTKWTGQTGEIYAGLRKSFGSDSVRPYLGGGLSFLRAQWESAGFEDDDTTLAAYGHAGIDFLVSQTFFIGLDVRVLFGSDITIGPLDGDADYNQAALRFGWRF